VRADDRHGPRSEGAGEGWQLGAGSKQVELHGGLCSLLISHPSHSWIVQAIKWASFRSMCTAFCLRRRWGDAPRRQGGARAAACAQGHTAEQPTHEGPPSPNGAVPAPAADGRRSEAPPSQAAPPTNISGHKLDMHAGFFFLRRWRARCTPLSPHANALQNHPSFPDSGANCPESLLWPGLSVLRSNRCSQPREAATVYTHAFRCWTPSASMT
jgi:hypothetical protein